MTIRAAVDTGGTFTDVVAAIGGRFAVHKVPSTPDDPARAIADVLAALLDDLSTVDVVHGSTVGTNALLERAGAVTALLTTAGFEDVLAIGRQNRRRLYDLDQPGTVPLVPAERRLGVDERILFDGQVERPLDEASIVGAIDRLRSIGDLEAVAVSCLNSYANDEHERRLGRALEPLGLHVSLSCEVLPEFREFERTSSTVVNAYLGPVMSRYLDRLADRLGARRLFVMHSGGGMMTAAEAGRFAGRTVLSGPAGGVLGAAAAAVRAGFEEAITFDMGGTSTDVALVRGRPATTSETEIDGMPLRFPMLDIDTVGAGGGSIARLEAGGALEVGPRSAGAVPGPICYGRGGTAVTVTDANLFLGRLVADRFLGGRMALDRRPVAAAVGELARAAGLEPAALARGVLAVAAARMERAIRVISVERGHDPRDCCLVAFGGAGPMHACHLARQLAIRTVLVPPDPGTLSARGMLLADHVLDFSRSHLGREPDGLDEAFAGLEVRAAGDLRAAGVAGDATTLERRVDVRYVGQSYELTVAAGPGWRERFDEAHDRRHGHAHPDWPVEIVTLRVRAVGAVDLAEPPPVPPGDPDASVALVGHQDCDLDPEAGVEVYDRALLAAGHALSGPALVVEMSATTVVGAGWSLAVDGHHNLILTDLAT